jgi:hypothetical protein
MISIVFRSKGDIVIDWPIIKLLGFVVDIDLVYFEDQCIHYMVLLKVGWINERLIVHINIALDGQQ